MICSVFVEYKVPDQFGVDQVKDSLIRKLMRGLGEETGSGSGFGWRDISFDVKEKDVDEIRSRLEQAGFDVNVYPVED